MNNAIRWVIAHGFQVLVVGLLSVLVIVIAGTSFRSPWNLRYAFNRVFYRPTFVCRDNTYSWAKSGSGACSSHDGIASRY